MENIFLFNLTSHQPDTDKIVFYAKDLYEAKCPWLIDEKSPRLKHLNNFKVFLNNQMLETKFIRMLQNII